ncbi:Ada metal-binding domain-containing protein [Persephonella sp.]
MKVFVLFAVLFTLVYSQERIYIENKTNYYHIETRNIPPPNLKKEKTIKTENVAEDYYVSKKKGKIFHKPSCKFGRKIKNKVVYKYRASAVSKGLRPCKVCKP